MSETSRRSILRGLVKLPLIGGAFAYLGVRRAAAEPASNLALLLDMERRLKAAEDALPAAYERRDASRRLFARQCPPEPAPICSFAWPTPRQIYYQTRSIDRWNVHKARLGEETGYTTAQKELDRLRNIRSGITMGEIWEVQATDLPSLKAKARMAMGGMSASLTRDVLAMEG